MNETLCNKMLNRLILYKVVNVVLYVAYTENGIYEASKCSYVWSDPVPYRVKPVPLRLT